MRKKFCTMSRNKQAKVRLIVWFEAKRKKGKFSENHHMFTRKVLIVMHYHSTTNRFYVAICEDNGDGLYYVMEIENVNSFVVDLMVVGKIWSL